MWNMQKNHVHYSLKFSLDLNGMLPLLTFWSTSPNKLILWWSLSNNVTASSRPVRKYPDLVDVTLYLSVSDQIFYLTPYPSGPMPPRS